MIKTKTTKSMAIKSKTMKKIQRIKDIPKSGTFNYPTLKHAAKRNANKNTLKPTEAANPILRQILNDGFLSWITICYKKRFL